jgi:hypothetical protein
MIRRNLSSCLRESALMWHTVELFDVSRRILFYEENVNEWVQAFIARFKTQITTTTINLLRERYTLTNAEKNRESREYAQKVIRWAKFAKMTSSFNQLNIVYNEIDVELRRDLKKSFRDTTIDDYLQLLNDCENIWWFLTKRSQEYSAYFTNFSQTNKQFQFNSSVRFYDNRSEFFIQQRYNNWNQQKNQRNQLLNQFNKWRSYFNINFYQYRNFQRQFYRNSQKAYQQQLVSSQSSRTQQINDSRNASKVIMTSSNTSNSHAKSQQFWQNKQFQKLRINYQNKFQKIHFDEYDSQYDEIWISKNEQNSSTYYDESEYYENKSYDETLKSSTKSEDVQSVELDQKISKAHFEEILNEKLTKLIKSSQLTLKCRKCERNFYFNNKLHNHLRSNQHSKKHQKVSKSHQKQITNISIITSTRDHKDHKEYAFREHQYARVKRALGFNDETHDFCANSETFMSLVDRKFVEHFKSEIKITSFKIQMKEIDFKTHDTSKYCFFNSYFREHFKEKLSITHIQEKFHLMNNLNVNMLIDINIMKFENCILNFKIKIMTFSFYENTKVSITITRID